MWKKVNRFLIQTTDKSKVMFKTTISYEILEQLKDLADEQDTYINYLLETGIQKSYRG